MLRLLCRGSRENILPPYMLPYTGCLPFSLLSSPFSPVVLILAVFRHFVSLPFSCTSLRDCRSAYLSLRSFQTVTPFDHASFGLA